VAPDTHFRAVKSTIIFSKETLIKKDIKMRLFTSLPKEVFKLCKAIKIAGGEGLLVGGCVRDEYFNTIHNTKLNSKDIDIEVFKLDEVALVPILNSFGVLTVTGEETDKFKVFKLKTPTGDYDLNLPRTETKVGQGHNDYDVEVDVNLSVDKAAERRDLTINAIYYNPLTKVTVDPFNGVEDIRKKNARHTTLKFAEDALRVLRIMQFVSRFDLTVDEETVKLCYSLRNEFTFLSKERVWEEFKKMACKGLKIKPAMDFLKDCGWYMLFPQIMTISSFSCWTDTFIMVDSIVESNLYHKRSSDNQLVLVLAALCLHMETPLDFLVQIDAPNKIQKSVLNLILVHTVVVRVYNCDEQHEWKKALVQLKVPRILFEHFVCSTPSHKFGQAQLFFRVNTLITDESLKKRVTGEDLMALGWTQGRALGDELNRLFDLQLKHNHLKVTLLSLVTQIN
jgi:tRNA nucleotidyltransferase (CCA-adding enzyme)